MPEDNVDVVRRLFSALDDNQFEEVAGFFDPEVEWSPTEGTFHGIEGVVKSFLEWMEPWDEHTIDPEEFIESGDDRVLATIHLTGRGEQSGVEINQRFFQLYTLRGGRITRMVEYVDRARALEAAGLPGSST
jgi:ketosteroid isomerase-like protein